MVQGLELQMTLLEICPLHLIEEVVHLLLKGRFVTDFYIASILIDGLLFLIKKVFLEIK